MSSKKIYNLLNDVDTDLSGYKEEPLTELEIKRIMKQVNITKENSVSSSENRSGANSGGGNGTKNSRRKTYKKAAALACACIIGLTAAGTVYSGSAYAMIKNVTYNIGSFLGTNESLEDYTKVINQTVTDKGYSVTLNEVIVEKSQLIVSKTIEGASIQDAEMVSADEIVFINGKPVHGASGGAVVVDNYTVEEVMAYDMENIDLSKDLDIEIQIRQINAYSASEQKSAKGNWDFKFSANGTKLAQNTDSTALSNSVQLPNGSALTLTEYSSSPAGQNIYFDVDKTGITDYNLELRGEDDLGNPVEFLMTTATSEHGMFQITTIDNGMVNKDASALTLTVYAAEQPKESGRAGNDFKAVGEAFTIELK